MNKTKKALFSFSFGLLLLNIPANGMEEPLLTKNGSEESNKKTHHTCFSSILEYAKENTAELLACVRQEICCCLRPVKEPGAQVNYHSLPNGIPK